MRSFLISIAALAATVLSLGASVASAEAATSGAGAKTPGEIAHCLANPELSPDQVVDATTVFARPGVPQQDIVLKCGNPEVFGARHIHAGHPINNPVNFGECYSTALAASPPPGPGNSPGSLAWIFEYAPGLTVTKRYRPS